MQNPFGSKRRCLFDRAAVSNPYMRALTSCFGLCAILLAACSGDDFSTTTNGTGGAATGDGGEGGTQSSGGSQATGGKAGSSGRGGNANGGNTAGGASGNGGSPSGGTAGGGGSSGGGTVNSGGAGAGGIAGGGNGGAATGGIAGSNTGGAPPLTTCRDDAALANVLFCDDFEAPGLPLWRHFALAGSDGETKRVTGAGVPKRGNAALQSTKTAPGSRDPLMADVLGNRTSGSFYARVWLYIPSTTQITDDINANATLMVLGETQSPLGGTSLALWKSGLTIQLYNGTQAAQAASFAVDAATFPRDAWFCLRWDFPVGPSVPKSAFHVRIGNAPLVNREPDAVVDSTLSHPYDRVWIGINHVSNNQLSPVVVYYDDVAVDTNDISCGF
jgi:hypothetical protein